MPAENLFEHISKFVPLSEAEEKVLLPYLRCFSLKKREHILKEGQVCHANYFVAKGCLRMYYITEQGTEQIVQFGIDNWWLADLMSLDMQKPSVFNIQAVEASEIIALDNKIQ